MAVVKNLIVRAGADFSELEQKMQAVGKKMSRWGKDVSKIGSSMTTGITLPIAGAVAGLGAVAIKAGQAADELITMSNKTGISTTQLQEMRYAARFVDVEVETMTSSMQKLTKSMDGARDGSGAQADAFKALGVSVTNSDGSLRNSKQVWQETITALGGVKNETERNAISMQLFGKSAAELNPLIVAGGDALAKYGTEAQALGIVMSEADVNALGKFDDSMQQLQATMEGAKNKLAVALLPAVESLIPIIQESIIPALSSFGESISGVITWFSDLDPKTQGFIAALVGMLAAAGPVLSIIGGIAGAIGTAIPVVSGIIAAIGAFTAGTATLGATLMAVFGPVGLIMIAIAALVALGVAVYKHRDEIVAAFIALKDSLAFAWNQIKTAATAMWTTLKTSILGIWGGIVAGIKGYINTIIKAMNWMISGLNKVKFSVPDWVPGAGGKSFGINIKPIPALATGTNYVPEDMLAVIHKGEAVVPKKYNEPSEGINVTKLYLDGREIATATGRVQYSKNRVMARSKGLVTT